MLLQGATQGALQGRVRQLTADAPRTGASARPPSQPRAALRSGRRAALHVLSAKKSSAPAPVVDWDAEAEALAASQAAARRPSSEEEQAKLLKETTQSIRRLGREGDAMGAVAALAELGKAGIQPDIMAVTTTIGACLENNDIPRAMRVFDELVGNGVVMPDEMLFSILLRAHGRRKPPAWGEVSALLGRMRNTHGLTAGITTYNALLEVCADNNDYDRGCQLIDRMEQEGVAPDAGTVAAVAKRRSLRAYLKRITG